MTWKCSGDLKREYKPVLHTYTSFRQLELICFMVWKMNLVQDHVWKLGMLKVTMLSDYDEYSAERNALQS